AAARANEFDLGGIFQRMVGQSSPSANGASTWCLGFAFGGKVHVRPARGILSKALNLRCSELASLVRWPCRSCPFRPPGGPALPLALPCNRQRPFFVAGDRQGFPLLVRATARVGLTSNLG